MTNPRFAVLCGLLLAGVLVHAQQSPSKLAPRVVTTGINAVEGRPEGLKESASDCLATW